eukprot:4024008-Pleurochrysis_carterae.AAC.4
MVSHRQKLQQMRARIDAGPPVAAFEGGRAKTPRKSEPPLWWRRAYGSEFIEVRFMLPAEESSSQSLLHAPSAQKHTSLLAESELLLQR